MRQNAQSIFQKAIALALIASLSLYSILFSGAIAVSGPKINDQGIDGPRELTTRPNPPFIQNVGQIDNKDVEFYFDGKSSSVFITGDGSLTYLFSKKPEASGNAKLSDYKTLAIKEIFVDGAASPAGIDRSDVMINHFVGARENWQTNIPSYNSIGLGEVWQSINVELKVNSGNVEKLFHISPYGDVARINIEFEGVESLNVNGAGELVLKTALGDATMTTPVAFQHVDGVRRQISIAYTVQNDGTAYGFAIVDPNYDPDYTLTIDPLLAATFFGSTSTDAFEALGLDSSGNIFVAGWTLSSTFPTTTGAFDETANGNTEVIVTKFNNALTSVLASTYIGGTGADSAYSLAIDSSDNVYVTGSARADFPTTTGAFSTTNNGGDDVFVSKLSNNLSSLLASTYIGSTNFEVGNSIVISSSGDVYVAGTTQSSSFPAFGTNAGSDEGFVSILNSNLTSMTARFLGGSNSDIIWALALDSSGNVFAAGETFSSTFPATTGAFDTTYNIAGDAFITKLNNTLGTLASTFVGGNETDVIYGLAVDSSGNVFVTGETNSFDYPTTGGAYDTSFAGVSGGSNTEIIVSRLSNNLDTLSASTFIGNADAEAAFTVAFDSSGNVYIAGQANSGTYPTTSGAYDETFNGSLDAVISKLNSSLSSLLASTYVGGSIDDYANAIKIDASNIVYVVGDVRSSDFPVTTGAANTTHNGVFDGFVAKFSSLLAPDTADPTGTILINGGATFSNSTSVSLTLSCSDDLSGCFQMKISVDGTFDTESFEAVATSKSVTLPSGDGTKTVKVIFRDADSNESGEISDTITLDTAAPSAPTITSPTNNSPTDATTDISGTAEAGSSVQVLVSGSTTPIGHAIADSGGNWLLSDPALGTIITKSAAEANAGFGESTAVGDVNGDGFDDVAVGVPFANNGSTDNGEVRLFLGGTGEFNTSVDATLTKTPSESGAEFGFSIAIGDVNGDGFGDIIAGARSADNGATNNGEVRVFFGSSGSFDTTADAVLTKSPAEISAQFGFAVATGNVNGDGFDDIIVGAWAADNGAFDNGEVRVFFGGSTFDTTVDATLTKSPAEASAFFGESVYSGNFNGDAFADIIVGSSTSDNGASNNGEARIFFGNAGALDTTADAVLTKAPAELEAGIGFAVSAGDINGDGFDDAVIGTGLADNGEVDNGEIRVFFGSSGSFDTTADAVLTKTPPEEEGFFGDSIAMADVNGDGFDDVITTDVSNVSGDGLVRVFLGNSGALDTTMDILLERVPTEFAANFGYPVASGDVNGDGFDDIVASASDADNGASNNGEVHIFSSLFTTALADGTRSISAKSKDGAGNLSPSSSSTSIVVYAPPLTNLSNDTEDSTRPSISAAGNNVHAIWEDSDNDDILYKSSADGGATFGSPTNVSNNNTGISVTPRIAANQTNGNIVYAVWSDNTLGNYSIFIRKSTDGGATFASVVNIGNNSGFSFNPHIAVSGANVHVVWAQLDSAFGVLYSKSTDAGVSFSTPVTISNSANNSSAPFVAIDSGGIIHVAWDTVLSGDSDILYSKSINNGTSFSAPINVSNDSEDSSSPVIATSGSNVHLVWQGFEPGQAEILYSKSTNSGTSFGTSTNLSNNDGLSEVPYASASGSNLFVVWADDSENGPKIYLKKSSDNGASFSGIIDLSGHISDATLPQSSISGRDLYVAWEDFSTHDLEIFFTKLEGISNSPPTSNAGSDQTVDEGSIVTLNGAASDPDNDSFTVTWTQTAGSAVTLSNSSSLTPTFTAPAITSNSVLTFQLAINDGAFTITDTVNINVSDRKGTLAIKKVDQDTGALLSGSAFTITPNPTTLTGSLTVQDGDAADTNSTAGAIRLANVEFGTYLIQETTIPSGYTRIVQNVTVSVHATQTSPTITIENKLAGTPVTEPITIPAPDLNVTSFNAYVATGAKVGGVTVDDVNDLPSAVLTGSFDPATAPGAITFNTTASTTSTTQQLVTAFNIPNYPSPEDALAQNNIYVAPAVVINQTGSSNKFLVTPVVEKTVSGMTLLVNQDVPVASRNATVKQVEMKFSNSGVATGVAFSFSITDTVPPGTPSPPSSLMQTSALFLNVGFIGNFGSATFSESGAFQSTPKIRTQVIKTLDVDKLADGCPDITLLLFSESTGLWSEVRKPTRDSTLDTATDCGYIVEPDHFSKFAVGGVKISVQAIAAIASTDSTSSGGGGGGRGASIPGSTDLTTYADSYFVSNPLAKMQITSRAFESSGTSQAFAGKEVSISTSFKNYQTKTQSYAYIVMIADENGSAVGIDYRLGSLQAGQTTVASVSWIPPEAGEYHVRIFVWNALDSAPVPLSDVGTMNMVVAS